MSLKKKKRRAMHAYSSTKHKYYGQEERMDIRRQLEDSVIGNTFIVFLSGYSNSLIKSLQSPAWETLVFKVHEIKCDKHKVG